MEKIRCLLASVKKIAESEPTSSDLEALVDSLEDQLEALGAQVEALNALTSPESEEAPAESEETAESEEAPAAQPKEASTIFDTLNEFRRASEVPVKNYLRINSICRSMEMAATLASRPQNASARPKLAAAVVKLAGLFAKVDTAEDLDRPLSEIENALQSLYKNPNDPSTYNFSERGKGPYKG